MDWRGSMTAGIWLDRKPLIPCDRCVIIAREVPDLRPIERFPTAAHLCEANRRGCGLDQTEMEAIATPSLVFAAELGGTNLRTSLVDEKEHYISSQRAHTSHG